MLLRKLNYNLKKENRLIGNVLAGKNTVASIFEQVTEETFPVV